jgi:hypothetical protein
MAIFRQLLRDVAVRCRVGANWAFYEDYQGSEECHHYARCPAKNSRECRLPLGGARSSHPNNLDVSRIYPIRANFVLTSCYPKRNIMLALFGNRPDFVLIAPISYCYPEAVSGLI